MKSMKFPDEFHVKVDMKKVKLDVIKPWVVKKITEMLGFEDEVLVGYVYGLLEEKQNPDPKQLQINLTGFLATDASKFTLDLWKLLISAQNSIGGIPSQLLEKKKEEILKKKAEHERIAAELSKKHAAKAENKSSPALDSSSTKDTQSRPSSSPSSKEVNTENGKDRKDKEKERDRERDREDRDKKEKREKRDREKERDEREERRDKKEKKERDRDREKSDKDERSSRGEKRSRDHKHDKEKDKREKKHKKKESSSDEGSDVDRR